MKLKNLFAFISFAAFTSFISSCGDSYAPITMVSLDGNTTISNRDTISLVKFSEGEQYNLKGGDGMYFVKVTNKDNSENKIISHQQEDNLLTLIPQNEGICYLNINDSEKNETRIVVNVERLDKFYTVESHNIIIDGNNNFTFGEKDEISRKITENALVNVGGKFEFQYTNSNNGIIKIKRTESSDYVTGTFTQEVIYSSQNGEKILSLDILIPNRDGFKLSLSEKKLTISQDLTYEYKGYYTNLESAVLEYNLSQPQYSDSNAK